jgi:hypothetical protein
MAVDAVVDVEEAEVDAGEAVGTMTTRVVARAGYRDHGKPKNQKAPLPMFACQLCKQEGHWVSRCPLLQQAALLVAPTMAPGRPPPSPAAPEDKPRAYAAMINDHDQQP